jgi:tRNA dimethylallyltransferase
MQTERTAIGTCISIVGATATGKTDVAVCLARALGGEILSADSVAVYRGLDIGSAKPDADTRREIPFHGIDVADPDEVYTAAAFRQLCQQSLASIWSRRRSALCCGGTGFYIRAALDGWGLTETPADPAVRERLTQRAAEIGNLAMHSALREVDPVSAERIHPNDRVRIVRALEVWEITGTPISVHQQRDREARKEVPGRRFGLECRMDLLDRHIQLRTTRMIESGWLKEVQRLLEEGWSPQSNALQSLGYAEMVQVAQGKITIEDAAEAITAATRRYARRQRTWFRADKRVEWIDIEGRTPDSLANEILTRLRQAGELRCIEELT